jgi:ABC-type multidrug transport system ATPase subunit
MATRSDADILLVDEVLAVGDADFQRKCYDYFKSLKRDKKTVVFVSHDMNAVREFCDRVVLIDKNQVVDSGTAARVSTKYTRLFMTNNAEVLSDEVAPEDNRWGDRQVTIEKLKLSTKSLTEDVAEITLDVTIKAQSDSIDTVAGFVIKNAADEEICGTNTRIMQQVIPPLARGQSYDMKWTIPNIFTDGTYAIDVAVHRSDGVTVNDWHEKALTFKVKRAEQTSYKTAPHITLRTV